MFRSEISLRCGIDRRETSRRAPQRELSLYRSKRNRSLVILRTPSAYCTCCTTDSPKFFCECVDAADFLASVPMGPLPTGTN